jgi:hypothetical protein
MGYFNVTPPEAKPIDCKLDEPVCELPEPKPVDCRPNKPACEEKDSCTPHQNDSSDICTPHQDDCDLQAALSSLPVAEAIDYAIGYLDSSDPGDTSCDWCPTDDPLAT